MDTARGLPRALGNIPPLSCSTWPSSNGRVTIALASLRPMLTTSTSQTGAPPQPEVDPAVLSQTTDPAGNLPHFPGIFPPVRADRCATARMVSANWLRRAGPCRDPRSLAASRSPTSAQCRESAIARVTKNRCLAPATSFCEYENTKPRTIWSALQANRAPGTPRHNCALASIVVINSNASSISGNSRVDAKPSIAGPSTSHASAARPVAR
jgi:hypothetical protein